MNFVKRSLFFYFFLVCFFAHADTVKNFPIKAAIEIQGSSSFYQVELSQEIYQNLGQNTLSEMRLFNAEDKSIPFIIQSNEPKSVVKKIRDKVLLSFFPIYGQENEREPNLYLQFKMNESGGVISLIDSATVKPTEKIYGYLVDLSGLNLKEKVITDLVFQWKTAEKSFVRSLHMEASSDLERWETVRKDVVLSQFRFENKELKKNKIESLHIKEKYLRITWPADQDFDLMSLRAQIESITILEENEEKTLDIDGIQKEGVLLFDIHGPLPITTLNLIHLPLNTILQGDWQECSSFLQLSDCTSPAFVRDEVYYHVTIDGKIISSPPTSNFHSIKNTHLIFRPTDSGVFGKNTEPTLRVTWRPDKIIFLAQGPGPFTLAFGKRDLKDIPLRSTDGLEQIIRHTKSEIPTAHVSKIQINQDLLQTEWQKKHERKIDIKTYSLWGVMAIALLFLGILAAKLFKQMNEQK